MTAKKPSKGASKGAPDPLSEFALPPMPPLPGEAGFQKAMYLLELEDSISRLVDFHRELQPLNPELARHIMVGAACIQVCVDEANRPAKAKRGRPPKVCKNQVMRAYYLRHLVLGDSQFKAIEFCADRFQLTEEGVKYQIDHADRAHVEFWLDMLRGVDRSTAESYLAI